jgi:hypothetical protein
MKRATIPSLLLVALALMGGFGASPALAYFAPLQDVTDPTVAQGTNTTVTVSVHNPATGQNIPYVWTIEGGAAAIAVDQITKSQGIVAWRVQDLINNKYKIVWGVYDPGWAALQGDPKEGWMFSETWAWKDHDTNIVALNDGVLLFETKWTSEGQTNIIDYFEAYDPSGWLEEPGPGPGPPQGWMPYGWREFSSSFGSYYAATTSGHIVKDGVAAFIYADPFWGKEMYYALYDGRVNSWQYDSASVSNPTAPQITNATVSWTDGITPQKRGYNFTSNSWNPDVDTKVMACFDFWPTPGKSGQWIYFTDMSIGATAWNYPLGDTTTTTARSFFHKYAKAGNYTVWQLVTGPTEDDSFSRIVPVKASGSPAPLLLLLGD